MPAADGATAATRYEAYADDCFDIVWPRIDEGDIVVFGGYYAIDRRMRRRMLPLLQHAAERKALLVYLPGYLPQQEPRITRVMPSILENMEMAHIVCTRSADLHTIFGARDAAACYRNNISFYCRLLLNVDAPARTISCYSPGAVESLALPLSPCAALIWNAGVAAGAVKALYEAGASPETLDAACADLRGSILRGAVATADTAVCALADDWQRTH